MKRETGPGGNGGETPSAESEPKVRSTGFHFNLAERERKSGELGERERRLMAEAGRGTLRALGNKLWERVPGVNVEAAREKLKTSPEFLKTVWGKKIWGEMTVGSALTSFSAGSAGGIAGRAVRYGLGAATGGAGYGIAVAGGAVSGALAEGIRTYIRERKREVERDEFVEKARQWGKKDEEIDRDRDALTKRERKISRISYRLDRYLELTDTEIPPDFVTQEGADQEKSALYAELKKEFGVRRKEVLRGMLKGAVIGAIGGVAGEGLMHLLGLRETAQAASAVTEAAKKAAETAKDETVNQALCNKMSAAAREAQAKAFDKGMKASVNVLDGKDFTEVAGRGEGVTHAARKAIHDYIVQNAKLGRDFNLGKAQLVYAEDWLKINIGGNKIVELGQNFQIRGDSIRAALYEAETLSKEQIENLNKEWVGKISQKTWDGILDYPGVSNPKNNFADGIIKAAKAQAEQAANAEVARCAKAAAAEANRQLQDKIAREAARISARNWLIAKLALGGIALGAAAAEIRFALKKKKSAGAAAPEAAGSPEEVFQDETVEPAASVDESADELEDEGAAEPAVVEPVVQPVVPEPKRRWWQRRKKAEQPEAPRREDITEPEVREGGDATAATADAAIALEREKREKERIQKEKEEKLQEKLARAGVPGDLRSRSVEEEERKWAADPFIKALQSKGITADKETTYYRVPDVEDMGKQKGIREINFTSYTDYRAYLEKMTVEQREWIPGIRYTSGPSDGKSLLGVWSRFWGDVNVLSEDAKKEVHALTDKAEGGLLLDEFRNKPEINDAAIQELQEQFNRRFSEAYGVLIGNSPRGTPALQSYNGIRKLIEAFAVLPDFVHFGNVAIRIGKNRIVKDDFLARPFRAEVHIDPSSFSSEEKMREYLINAASEIGAS